MLRRADDAAPSPSPPTWTRSVGLHRCEQAKASQLVAREQRAVVFCPLLDHAVGAVSYIESSPVAARARVAARPRDCFLRAAVKMAALLDVVVAAAGC
jgi:hypothetical protein